MINSLLYLIISKPNIMFTICMCACFQSNPKETYLYAIKRILRYLKGTHNISLLYPRSNSCYLFGYTDADYTNNRTDKKKKH